MDWLIFALFLAIAVASSICARLTRPERSYWPMLRAIWMVVGFAYGGSAVGMFYGLLVGTNPGPVSRLAFTAAMLAAVVYSAWFMRRRNRTPRFLGLNLQGDIIITPVEELARAATLVESWAAHGAMPEDLVARHREALAEWERQRAWAQGVARDARARRLARERGGVPDD